MDGDMRLYDGFVDAAVRFLQENPTVSGVGGTIIDRELGNLEFAQRSMRHDPDRRPGPVTRLNGCGVYRRAAIEPLGYLTDRNLHGGEELDLAARLDARGWRLARIDRPAVDHYGHTGSAYRLLLHRIETWNACGPGEIIRAAIGQPHFRYIVRNDRVLPVCCLVAGWWLAIAAVPSVFSGLSASIAVAALAAFPIAAMSLRWRSIGKGLYSVAAWNVYALCFLPGLLRSRIAPAQWIKSSVLTEREAVTQARMPAGGEERRTRDVSSAQSENIQ
jgi:hypothetical protein